MMLTLWLVRHGETNSNAEGMFQGHLDIELNERGERQARSVGDYFGEQAFDAVFSSDLRRASRTAELIVGDRAQVNVIRELRELHYGVLQGVRYADAASALAEHGLSESWSSGAFHRSGKTIPGGESFRRLRGRSSQFERRLDHLVLDASPHNVLVVAHGGTLGVLMTVLLGLPLRARSSFRFANCSISRLTRTPERTTLDLHNLVVWDERLAASSPARSDQSHDPGESHRPRS